MYCVICEFQFSGIYCPRCGMKGTYKRQASSAVSLTNTISAKLSCENCLSMLAKDEGEFCTSCGHKNSEKLQERNTMTFTDYKRSFNSHKKRIKPGKQTKQDQRSTSGTIISLKEMIVKEDGSLNSRSGYSIPLQVNVDDGAHHVHMAAHEKMSRYCSSFTSHFSCTKLVYKTGETVKYIPGTNEPFTVRKYKDDSGLQYSRIVLYLQVHDILSNSSSSDESALPEVMKKKSYR